MADELVSTIEKETTAVVLATFAEAYRLEISAEEDVYRTLPFFGTALGIVIAAIGYAAGRLTPWGELPVHWLFLASSGLLALAALESIGVIVRLSQALARRDYQRIGPESALQERLDELRVYYDDLVNQPPNRDALLARDFQEALIASYARVTPLSRELNAKGYHYRALAASHLVRSLLWHLGLPLSSLCRTTLDFYRRLAHDAPSGDTGGRGAQEGRPWDRQAAPGRTEAQNQAGWADDLFQIKGVGCLLADTAGSQSLTCIREFWIQLESKYHEVNAG